MRKSARPLLELHLHSVWLLIFTVSKFGDSCFSRKYGNFTMDYQRRASPTEFQLAVSASFTYWK
jgi:hypothetical protein